MILNVFVCNMLLQNACNNHQKYVRKTYENGPNMVPKPLQNRSWRGSEHVEFGCENVRLSLSMRIGPKLQHVEFGCENDAKGCREGLK